MSAMAPFGGGMGSSGRICGTLSGALAVIGFTLGKTEARGRDHKLMWKLSYRLVKEFDKICREYGGTNCRDIAGVNWNNRESVHHFYKDPESGRKNCVNVIRKTSEYLHTLISENFKRNSP
jgi:C_GCAxxG_C_C family probable redox protein